MAAKDEFGRAGEERAAEHLTGLGYTILDRNWRCPQGEIDIVAACGERLSVVEVKTRRTIAFGHPLSAIDERKRRRLWRLAHAWIQAHPEQAAGRTLRLEAIGITGVDPRAAIVEHLADLT